MHIPPVQECRIKHVLPPSAQAVTTQAERSTVANIDQKQPKASPLFLVRLWADPGVTDAAPDDPQHGSSDIRGKVLHVVTGEAHSFHSWAELVTLMRTMISGGGLSAFQTVTLPQDTQDIDHHTVPVTSAREST